MNDFLSISYRYQVDQICVFTNRGTSGNTDNDGKHCRIIRLKPIEEWFQGEPEYVIEFLGENHGFGVRECELNSTTEKGGLT